MHPGLLPALRLWKKQPGLKLAAFDFDGTLAPMVRIPEEGALPKEEGALLDALSQRKDFRVAVISGRDLNSLHTIFGDRNTFIFSGDHGHEIEADDFHYTHTEALAASEEVHAFFHTLKSILEGADELFFEEKKLSAALFFRYATPEDKLRFLETARFHAPHYHRIKLMLTENVCEIAPNTQWHKGCALNYIAKHYKIPEKNCLFAGDEINDEPAFDLCKNALTFKVGAPPTQARYTISHQGLMKTVLAELLAD